MAFLPTAKSETIFLKVWQEKKTPPSRMTFLAAVKSKTIFKAGLMHNFL